MIKKIDKSKVRINKHRKLRKRFMGTQERPRLSVYRSNNHMYAQVIDDTTGTTLCAASTLNKEIAGGLNKTSNQEAAAKVGEEIAKMAIAKGINTVVFDRGGMIYQGRVSALAQAARDAGLQF